MTLEQLRVAYETQPFQPFVLHLADGRNVPVPSREFIHAFPNGRTVSVWHNNAMHIIDLLLVTELELRSVPPRRRRAHPEA